MSQIGKAMAYAYARWDALSAYLYDGNLLRPNLHRAFDRRLVSVDEDYTIMVSTHIDELVDHPCSMSKLNGRSILLPQLQRYYPSHENLAWHREKVFKI